MSTIEHRPWTIPKKKLNNSLKMYATLEEEEKVLFLFDSTIFGSAEEGVV